MAKATAVRKVAPVKAEPWVKTSVIRELFSLSYGFISKHTKPDPEHPDWSGDALSACRPGYAFPGECGVQVHGAVQCLVSRHASLNVSG